MYESVTITTRKPQDDEKESKKYVFVDEAEFQVSTSHLLYHRVKNGDHYGIHVNQVSLAIKNKQICVLDLNIDGAKQVFATGLTCNFLFITPPTRDELITR